IDQKSRQWQDHHKDDANQQERQYDVVPLCQRLKNFVEHCVRYPPKVREPYPMRRGMPLPRATCTCEMSRKSRRGGERQEMKGTSGARADAVRDLFGQADRQMLAELGFAAIGADQAVMAEKIFRALSLLAPEGDPAEAATIGSALAIAGQGRVDDAVERLRGAEPSDTISVYLGIMLGRAGREDEAIEILTDLLATGPDPENAALAEGALSEIEAGRAES
ncbi:MAG: hypothetical protein AAGF76_10520, partial [Pseudomonadota bacterium]